MTKKTFNKHGLKDFNEVVDKLSGLKQALTEQNINLLELDEVHIFGYGSLPNLPHYPPTSKTNAYLWDYSKDMSCKSVGSGTTQKTGLTLGADKKDGAIIAGSILSYKNLDSDELTDMLEAFEKRENVKTLPIYKFDFLEVELENGKKVNAITCVADPDQTMGYAGDMLTSFDKNSLSEKTLEDLSLRKKAQEIAWSNGMLKKSKTYATGKSYFDRFVRMQIEENLITLNQNDDKRQVALYKEQQRMLKLAQYVDEEREHMRSTVPEYVAALEKQEALQMRQLLDKRKEADTSISINPTQQLKR